MQNKKHEKFSHEINKIILKLIGDEQKHMDNIESKPWF